MRRRLVTLAMLLGCGALTPHWAQRRPARTDRVRASARPYVGCWSDASGDYLFVTAGKIKYGRGRWVRYAELPERPGGKGYLLRLFSPGEFNFLSNVVSLSPDGGEMRMILYESFKDYTNGKKLGWGTWHKDRCGAR
jgi:hypothetical protein